MQFSDIFRSNVLYFILFSRYCARTPFQTLYISLHQPSDLIGETMPAPNQMTEHAAPAHQQKSCCSWVA